MKPQLTQTAFRYVTASTFAKMVASVESAADAFAPLGQRDGSRRGNDRGDRMMERRNVRRAKLAARLSVFN